MAYISFSLNDLAQNFRSNAEVDEPVPANDVEYGFHLINLDTYPMTPMKITFQNGHPRKIEIPNKNNQECFSIYHDLESHHPQDAWPAITEQQYNEVLGYYNSVQTPNSPRHP